MENKMENKIIIVVYTKDGKISFTKKEIEQLNGLFFVDAYKAFLEEFPNEEENPVFEMNILETTKDFEEFLEEFKRDVYFYKKMALYRKYIDQAIYTDDLEDELIREYEYSLIPECECCGEKECVNEGELDEEDSDDDFDFLHGTFSNKIKYRNFK